jgi:hypothetical protein
MKSRCYNHNREDYAEYGAKGIIVCQEWLDKENGFINFYQWSIENGYQENLSIDRINVYGNYEPGNCRWTNDTIQANNKTNTIYITYKDETKKLSEWSKLLNINYDTLHGRIFTYGMTVNEAFTLLNNSREEIQKLYVYNGETNNLYEWSKILNIRYSVINRILQLRQVWYMRNPQRKPLRRPQRPQAFQVRLQRQRHERAHIRRPAWSVLCYLQKNYGIRRS